MTDEIVKRLKAALASEWQAYYQYWVSSVIAIGKGMPGIVNEFKDHADEEKEHADLIAERLYQLGETPVFRPSDWEANADCPYPHYDGMTTLVLLDQNLEAEKCAVKNYQELAKLTAEADDFATNDMVVEILRDENEHETDLAKLKFYIMAQNGNQETSNKPVNE